MDPASTDPAPLPARASDGSWSCRAATRTGTQATGKAAILKGVDAVLYRTKFFGPDGRRDWACVFAKGRVMVVVHTQRSDTSLNALLLAKAIAKRI